MVFTYYRYYARNLHGNVGHFVLRVLAAYFVTIVVSGSILLAINQLTTTGSAIVAIKRVVIVSFPASFAATVVDGLSHD